ncbi:MAG: Acyl-CoA dehydrogenase [Flavobacterium sp. SCGC AAA160-P02]|nr:MAG: Acyl-CoA dehydrogenase [Flavobacterium sp. SCGC AAA160-P02]
MNNKSPDYYDIDALLNEEQKLVRDSIRDWVKENVSPIIEDSNFNASFPKELIKLLADVGGFGSIFPEKYGGISLDYISYGLMMQELERGDSSVRVFCSIQTSLVMNTIYTFGSDELKQTYLNKLSRGELVGSFGLSEPNHGSDPSSMDMTYIELDDCYLLNGSKMWIGNAPFCDIAVVWARSKEDGYACFLVERETPGFTTSKIERKWSFRASETGELILHDAKVPKNLMLHKSCSIKPALKSLNIARYAVAWGALGIAMECYEIALNYANERTQFGKKIGSNQLIQKKLVYMITEITKCQLLSWRLGKLMDKDKATFEQISMAKRNNVEVAYNIARQARQILGGMGITGEYPIMRHLFNLETLITYQGTDEIHTLITGRDITGISAF